MERLRYVQVDTSTRWTIRHIADPGGGGGGAYLISGLINRGLIREGGLIERGDLFQILLDETRCFRLKIVFIQNSNNCS